MPNHADVRNILVFMKSTPFACLMPARPHTLHHPTGHLAIPSFRQGPGLPFGDAPAYGPVRVGTSGFGNIRPHICVTQNASESGVKGRSEEHTSELQSLRHL